MKIKLDLVLKIKQMIYSMICYQQFQIANRTQAVLSSLHKMIERYRQVRRMYSDFDNYGNAINAKS